MITVIPAETGCFSIHCDDEGKEYTRPVIAFAVEVKPPRDKYSDALIDVIPVYAGMEEHDKLDHIAIFYPSRSQVVTLDGGVFDVFDEIEAIEFAIDIMKK